MTKGKNKFCVGQEVYCIITPWGEDIYKGVIEKITLTNEGIFYSVALQGQSDFITFEEDRVFANRQEAEIGEIHREIKDLMDNVTRKLISIATRIKRNE